MNARLPKLHRQLSPESLCCSNSNYIFNTTVVLCYTLLIRVVVEDVHVELFTGCMLRTTDIAADVITFLCSDITRAKLSAFLQMFLQPTSLLKASIAVLASYQVSDTFENFFAIESLYFARERAITVL
jgi:hypothetical protein